MAWFLRVTRFASLHAVYAQEQKNSCGIASVMMVNFKEKKGLIAAAASTAAIPIVGSAIAPALTKAALKSAIAVETEVYKAYAEVSGKAYDGSAYTYTDDLAKVLNKLGIGTWEDKFVGENSVAGAVLDSLTGGSEHPIILLTNWKADGGGHFVVCDEVHDFMGTKYACICDPWNGDVVITSFKRGEAFNYTAKDPFGSWDLGGKKHSYAAPQESKMNGWVVRRK
jgi:hypothetical protein